MELQEAIQNRRSIRRFLPKPVSEEIIRELVAKALWAPSWGNTQSWGIVIATDDRLEQFKKENKKAVLAGEPSVPEISMPQAWPEKDVDWARYWEDSHCTVAIGYSRRRIYFEDPWVFNRVFLTNKELIERWHDYDDIGKGYCRGIAVHGRKPVYSSKKIIHMD